MRHTTLCALEVIFNTLEIALLQNFLLNFETEKLQLKEIV